MCSSSSGGLRPSFGDGPERVAAAAAAVAAAAPLPPSLPPPCGTLGEDGAGVADVADEHSVADEEEGDGRGAAEGVINAGAGMQQVIEL